MGNYVSQPLQNNPGRGAKKNSSCRQENRLWKPAEGTRARALTALWGALAGAGDWPNWESIEMGGGAAARVSSEVSPGRQRDGEGMSRAWVSLSLPAPLSDLRVSGPR